MIKCPRCGKTIVAKTVELRTEPNNITEYQYLVGCEKCRLYLPESFKVRLTLNKLGRIEILEQDNLNEIKEKWYDFIKPWKL
jgi:hypothetical protein